MIENEEQKKYLENIITQIESGKLLSEIVGKRMGKIKRLLFEECGERGRNAVILDFERTYPILDIIQLYNNGNNYEMICEELGLSYGQIGEIVSEYEYITGKKLKHLYSGIRYDIDNDKIIEDYRLGRTMRQIAEEYGCSDMPIQKRIIEYIAENGDDIRKEHNYNYRLLKLAEAAKKGKQVQPKEKKTKGRYRPPKIKLDSKAIYLEHKEKKTTYEELARKYHVSITTIGRRIREYIFENEIDINDNNSQQDSDGEEKKLKIATRYSIENILTKYKYSYEELSAIALEAGYAVPKDVYDSVVESLKNNRKGEDR